MAVPQRAEATHHLQLQADTYHDGQNWGRPHGPVMGRFGGLAMGSIVTWIGRGELPSNFGHGKLFEIYNSPDLDIHQLDLGVGRVSDIALRSTGILDIPRTPLKNADAMALSVGEALIGACREWDHPTSPNLSQVVLKAKQLGGKLVGKRLSMKDLAEGVQELASGIFVVAADGFGEGAPVPTIKHKRVSIHA